MASQEAFPPAARNRGLRLVRQADILSAFSLHRGGVQLRWAHKPGRLGSAPAEKSRLAASRELHSASFAEHSSSTNIRNREAANGQAGCSPSRNRCSKQSSSTQSALSFI